MKTSGQKKRIAIIIPGGIGTGKNNIGVPVLEQLIRLLARDFEITVFSLFKVNEDYIANGFELVSISVSNPLLRFLKTFSIFRRKHKNQKYDIVHGFWAMPSGFFAVLLGRILGIRSIVSLLGGDAIALPEIKYGQLQRRLPRNLILWTLKRADVVICLTHYLVNNLKKAGLKRLDIKVIPWGIDTSLFTFQEKELSIPIQFLHIANLHPVKDQETLLRAFKIISDHVSARLILIGEGILLSNMKSLASTLGMDDKIIFQSPLPYTSLPPYYHKADILLHTSLSEGQSEVVTEAMCSGVVVCGTNVGLIHDLPDCCIAVPVRDFEKLGHEVLTLLKDPGRLRMIKEDARTWATRHDLTWTVEMIRALYLTSLNEM